MQERPDSADPRPFRLPGECFPPVRAATGRLYRLPMGLVLVVALLASCGCVMGPPAPVRLELSTLPAVRFGAFPFLDRAVLRHALQPLLDHLQNRLQRPVRLVVVKNYGELERLVRQKRIDIGWFTPRRSAASGALGLEPVGRPTIRGEGGAYHGIIVVRRDQGFQTLQSLAGRSFAYVDRQSKSGFLFPNLLFAGLGINPLRHFSHVEFLGTHDRCLAGVLDGSVAAAAVTDLMTRSPAWAGHFARDLAILATTAPILPDPIVIRSEDPPLAPASLTEILREMAATPEGRRALSQLQERIGITGFAPMERNP